MMTESADGAHAPASAVEDCWNRIGVRGDRSCPQLREHVHCRNCSVYSGAAMSLLDTALPASYSLEWTSHFATPKPAEERETRSVVIFRIGLEWFALPTDVVEEITDLQPIHSLPHRTTGVVLGLASVRGELVVCVSLPHLLGLEPPADRPTPQERGVRTRLLVIRRERIRTVCPTDEVYGVHRFHQRDMKELPATVARSAATYSKAVVSWREYSVGLLDDQLLLHSLQRSLA